MGWKSGKEHKTKGPQKEKLGPTHTDVEKYDERGRKDKSAGKMKISGGTTRPSMTDIRKPK
jgi:hypothetical protein